MRWQTQNLRRTSWFRILIINLTLNKNSLPQQKTYSFRVQRILCTLVLSSRITKDHLLRLILSPWCLILFTWEPGLWKWFSIRIIWYLSILNTSRMGSIYIKNPQKLRVATWIRFYLRVSSSCLWHKEHQTLWYQLIIDHNIFLYLQAIQTEMLIK